MKGMVYICSMPADMRVKWTDNLDSHTIEAWKRHDFDSFLHFLRGTIGWSSSNEGFDYWSSVQDDVAMVVSIEREARLTSLGV